MTDEYLETEVKVLDVDEKSLSARLESLGAKKVFDADRIITYFDYPDSRLAKIDKLLKLTEEEKLKLTFSEEIPAGKRSVKVFVSRKKEMVDLLGGLELRPIAECTAHRTSYEWEGVDFDIDQFPQIPAFVEIDIGNSGKDLNNVLSLVNLVEKEILTLGTPGIYKKLGLDYFSLFKVSP